jgi:hypothetical protein
VKLDRMMSHSASAWERRWLSGSRSNGSPRGVKPAAQPYRLAHRVAELLLPSVQRRPKHLKYSSSSAAAAVLLILLLPAAGSVTGSASIAVAAAVAQYSVNILRDAMPHSDLLENSFVTRIPI